MDLSDLLSAKEGQVEDVRLGMVLAVVAVRWKSLVSKEEGTKQRAEF